MLPSAIPDPYTTCLLRLAWGSTTILGYLSLECVQKFLYQVCQIPDSIAINIITIPMRRVIQNKGPRGEQHSLASIWPTVNVSVRNDEIRSGLSQERGAYCAHCRHVKPRFVSTAVITSARLHKLILYSFSHVENSKCWSGDSCSVSKFIWFCDIVVSVINYF